MLGSILWMIIAVIVKLQYISLFLLAHFYNLYEEKMRKEAMEARLIASQNRKSIQ